MKKRTMNLLIMAAFLALYLGVTGVLCILARKQASDEFADYTRSAHVSYAAEAVNSDEIAKYNTPEGYIYYLTNHGFDDFYGKRFYLVDTEGNVAASNDTVITIYGSGDEFEKAGLPDPGEKYYSDGENDYFIIGISELMTEDMRDLFLNYVFVRDYGLRDGGILKNISYYTEDGNIIPVSITFRGSEDIQYDVSHYEDTSVFTEPNGDITFIFSDHAAENTLNLWKEDGSPYLCGNIYLDDAYYGQMLSHTSEMTDYVQEKFTKWLNNKIAASNSGLELAYDLNSTLTCDVAYYTWDVSINKAPYTLVYVIGVDFIYEAVHTTGFTEYEIAAIFVSVLFLVLLVVTLIFAGKMYEKNRMLNEARRSFTSAVAHELKTPLAIIQSQSECIMEGVDPEKNEEYLSAIYEEARRMNRMVMSFLQYNRLSMADKVETSDENISDMIRKEIDKYQPMLEDENRNLNIEIEDNIRGQVNPDLFRLAVDNFLSNAAKYTTSIMGSSEISIRLERTTNGYRFSIFNTCRRFAIDCEEVWHLLTKEDASRHRSENSSGMGLPIAAEILKLHKLEYACKKVPGGVRFEFWSK